MEDYNVFRVVVLGVFQCDSKSALRVIKRGLEECY